MSGSLSKLISFAELFRKQTFYRGAYDRLWQIWQKSNQVSAISVFLQKTTQNCCCCSRLIHVWMLANRSNVIHYYFMNVHMIPKLVSCFSSERCARFVFQCLKIIFDECKYDSSIVFVLWEARDVRVSSQTTANKTADEARRGGVTKNAILQLVFISKFPLPNGVSHYFSWVLVGLSWDKSPCPLKWIRVD